MSVNSNWTPTRWAGCLLKTRDLGDTNSGGTDYVCSRRNIWASPGRCWAASSQWEASVGVEKEQKRVWAAMFAVNYQEKGASSSWGVYRTGRSSKNHTILWASCIQREEVTRSSQAGGSLHQHTSCSPKDLSSIQEGFPTAGLKKLQTPKSNTESVLYQTYWDNVWGNTLKFKIKVLFLFQVLELYINSFKEISD